MRWGEMEMPPREEDLGVLTRPADPSQLPRTEIWGAAARERGKLLRSISAFPKIPLGSCSPHLHREKGWSCLKVLMSCMASLHPCVLNPCTLLSSISAS